MQRRDLMWLAGLTAPDLCLSLPALATERELRIGIQKYGSLVLLKERGLLEERLIVSSHQVVEYLVENSTLAPEYIRADLIMPPDPDTDLAAEPDALWVNAFTNPVFLRLRPLAE